MEKQIVSFREFEQQKVRESIMKYAVPNAEHDGMTAWELSGILLDAARNAEFEYRELESRIMGEHDCTMDTHGYCPACDELYRQGERALSESENYRLSH